MKSVFGFCCENIFRKCQWEFSGIRRGLERFLGDVSSHFFVFALFGPFFVLCFIRVISFWRDTPLANNRREFWSWKCWLLACGGRVIRLLPTHWSENQLRQLEGCSTISPTSECLENVPQYPPKQIHHSTTAFPTITGLWIWKQLKSVTAIAPKLLEVFEGKLVIKLGGCQKVRQLCLQRKLKDPWKLELQSPSYYVIKVQPNTSCVLWSCKDENTVYHSNGMDYILIPQNNFCGVIFWVHDHQIKMFSEFTA